MVVFAEIFENVVLDGIFAAIAGIGFGAVSNPPRRAFVYIAILAAAGHALRYVLMDYFSFDIATASLFASFTIGMGSLLLGRAAYCPMTVLFIPALLPMIPGKFAYNMVFSLIMFMHSLDVPEDKSHFLEMFFSNAILTSTTIFMLVIGACLPMFLFPSIAFSITRRK